LKSVVRNGGVPSTAPFDIFERSWVMWNVSLIESMDEELLKSCLPHLDFLEAAWKPGKGVSYASVHILPDGDDTALTFDVLNKFGRTEDIAAVLSYEEADYFRCYSFETTPSTSANVHIIGALRQVGYEVDHPTIQKLLNFLKKSKQTKTLWIDKWHTSPYYTSSHAVIACTGYDDDFVQQEIKWILASQNKNGSWGYSMPTAEETAYCIQALSIWKRYGGGVPEEALKRGVAWLTDHSEPPYPPLWIGKCLYCPEYVVQSTILSALMCAS
jgi:halimadienyl-diphosphate synthase